MQGSKQGRAGQGLAAVVLAAGQGTRMKSRRAKVLHEICGRPMLGHILEAAASLDAERFLVVVGRDADEVEERFAGRAEFVLQAERRGTGHAVLQAKPALEGFSGDVLVLYGDTPLLQTETLRRMSQLKEESGAGLVMLTSPEPLPGLIVRDEAGRVQRVVERTDATPEELLIQEGNTGVYLVDSALLWEALSKVDDSNAQGEIYLTDIVSYAVESGAGLEALKLDDAEECLGVNNRAELAEAARVMRRRINEHWLAEGVTLIDPASTWIDADVVIGRDSVIEPGCALQGQTVLGEGVHLKPHCMIEESHIGDDAVVGPSAHLRPGTQLGKGCRVGNFVEIKNSTLGDGCKADHLSYIGDATVGEGSAFGCGSITVNYDWKTKHRTVVGRNSTIGCNVNLVAPVTVGDDVAVAAGSTITQDVPSDSLAVARTKQRHIGGWVSRRERAEAGGGSGSGSRATKKKGPAKAKKATAKKKARAKKKTGKASTPRKKSSAKAKAGKTTKARKKKAARR